MPVLLEPTHPELLAHKERFEQEGLNPEPSNQQPDWVPLHWFCVSSNPDFAKAQAWVECGGCVNVQTQGGDTPLHLAVWNRHEERVRWLLEMGANPNLPNAKGNTPIHQAFRRREWGSAWAMIQAGVDWSMQDGKGMSTLAHLVGQLQFSSTQPKPPLPEGHVREAMWEQPKELWRRPFSHSNDTPLIERLPQSLQSLLQEKWLNQSLPDSSPSRSNRPRL